MNLTIVSATYIENYSIEVEFDNGIKKLCDLTFLVKRFPLIKNKAFFKCFKIDCGGKAISWNDDIDISEYGLFKLENPKRD